MATGGDISAIAETCVEEKLMFSILMSPPEPCRGLLDSLEHVDVRMLRQRTLLHVGVSLGKVEWVEELLGRGADPNLKDGSDVTALHSAEEMLKSYPDDSDRRQVSRLMRLVHRRDQAMRRRIETSSVENTFTSTSPVVPTQHVTAMTALSSSVDALKEEMRSLRAELRSSLEELKEQVCGRDALLRCLEAAVTSSAEQLTSLNGRLQGETNLGATGTALETPLPLSNMANERRECVDGMMRRTEVVHGGEEGVRFMRRLYGRIYDEDDATACLLQFLHRESRFVAKVDCGSYTLEGMKTYLYSDMGVKHGRDWTSFAEFYTNTVYLGAMVFGRRTEGYVAGRFAEALAHMSVHLCFNNGGKPYEGGDEVHEGGWKRAFEEAEEEERKRGLRLCGWISRALHWCNRAERESVLAAIVPSIIAQYGSTEGTRLLREQVPGLLDFYKDHVVVTLLSRVRIMLVWWLQSWLSIQRSQIHILMVAEKKPYFSAVLRSLQVQHSVLRMGIKTRSPWRNSVSGG